MTGLKRHLFIDFDNTMMGTEKFGVPSLIARFNELYGGRIDHALTYEEFVAHFHGMARENLCGNLSRHFNIPVDYKLLYAEREWRMMQYLKQIPGGVPMAPNLLPALRLLRQRGFILAFVSNNSIQRALAALRFADNGMGGELLQILGTNFFEAGDTQKPKPDVYLNAMEFLDAHAAHSFAVEDSITGVTAAVHAGIKTFGYTGLADHPEKDTEKLLAAGAVSVLQDWAQLPELPEFQ